MQVTTAAAGAQSSSTPAEVAPLTLKTQVQFLQDQLNQVRLDQVVGDKSSGEVAGLQKDLTQ